MTQTKIGVVYDESTGQVLRVVIPDNDEQLALHVNAGEKLIKLDKSEYHSKSHDDVQKIVEDATGKIQAKRNEDKPKPLTDEELAIRVAGGRL